MKDTSPFHSSFYPLKYCRNTNVSKQFPSENDRATPRGSCPCLSGQLRNLPNLKLNGKWRANLLVANFQAAPFSSSLCAPTAPFCFWNSLFGFCCKIARDSHVKGIDSH